MPKSGDKSGSTQHETVLCDLEFPRFQKELANLESVQLEAVFNSVEKIEKMTWNQIYKTSTKGRGKRGLNYEKLERQRTREGRPIGAIRVSAKFRARVVREGRYMRLISLHPDHDSAFDETGGEDA